MSEQNRHRYWIDRFIEDSPRLSEDQRVALQLSYLKHFCELSDQQLAAFSDPEKTFSIEDYHRSMHFLAAEQKISTYMSTEYPNRNTKAYKRLQTAAQGYQTEFGEILDGVYTDSEVHEIGSLIVNPWEWGELRVIIVGHHWLGQRIRNAYLPAITDYIVNGEDATDQLFNGPDDAATQIDTILGK